MRSSVSALLLVLPLSACAGRAMPLALSQADAVAASPAAVDSEQFAPQAHATAENLLSVAHELHKSGRNDEASVVSEQAVAAYEESFALSRALRAKERLAEAQKVVDEAEARLADLEQRQARASRDAEAYELRARVALDKEEVTDVSSLTPERARARRRAAVQLTSEGRLLCLAASELDSKAEGLEDATKTVKVLENELSVGSSKDDLYPRAALARTACLKTLSSIRRAAYRQAPEEPGSDAILEGLTKTGKVFAFRDDRGVVVNLLNPVVDGELTEAAQDVIKLLGATSRENPKSPLLVVGHSARSSDKKSDEENVATLVRALKKAGAKDVASFSVGTAQPVVHSKVRDAASRNSRIEVVFVSSGR